MTTLTSVLAFLGRLADLLLFLLSAFSVTYIFFFAVISLFQKRRHSRSSTPSSMPAPPRHRFLVLYPAYAEDAVILTSVRTFLQQDYPAALYHLTVISDHMQAQTNESLRALPITLLTATYDHSSKAKALKMAMRESASDFDFVVILDADNEVRPDFLSCLSARIQDDGRAYQCHRTAKNAENDIAALDGLSEEINNTLFRRAHNTIGLPSALIGSGICFPYRWFSTHVSRLSSAGEDRELEAMLLEEGIYTEYVEDIPVYDQKVSSASNFQRQRLRWMTAQAQQLASMGRRLPHAVRTRNFAFIDKTLQQAVIPRAMLVVVLAFMALLTALVSVSLSAKWWVLLALLVVSLLIAVPSRLRRLSLLRAGRRLPLLALRMIANVFHLRPRSNEFIHTQH